MKKLSFLLLFPLWGLGGLFPLGGTGGLFAAVTVTPLGVNYSTQEVTFKIAWQNAAVPYKNRVWVWIDLCPVAGTTPAMSFSTATVSSPAIASGNGTITGATARGFFIEYANATNTGTTVTATLSNATGQFNWCAYGSDYPPNAVTNAGGGYTLRGTKPFTVNSSQTIDADTFGTGTCITSITDLTGRPDGFAPALTISNANSPSRCSAGGVMLTATVGSGATTAMTYTWTVGSTAYTNNTNSYNTASLSASAAYTVKVKNANNCESNTVGGNITVNYPGNNGQTAHATCDCATGTTNCNGTCKTTGTYPTEDGACTGACNTAYVQLRNQCGVITNSQHSTYTNTGCTTPNYPTEDGDCTDECQTAYVQLRDACGKIIDANYGYYTASECTKGCLPNPDLICKNERYIGKTAIDCQKFCAEDTVNKPWTRYWGKWGTCCNPGGWCADDYACCQGEYSCWVCYCCL